MATSTFRNKNKVRPIKNGAAKRARVKAQCKRLVELGFSPEEARVLRSDLRHAYLKRPVLTKQIQAAKKEAAAAENKEQA